MIAFTMALNIAQGKVEPTISDRCAEILMLPSVESVSQATTAAMVTFQKGSKESDAAVMYYACLLLEGSHSKGLIKFKMNMTAFANPIFKLSKTKFKSPEVRLLQGWWLRGVAPQWRFRDWSEGKLSKMKAMMGGKIREIDRVSFGPDPAVSLGEKLIKEALPKCGTSLVADHYRMRSEPVLPEATIDQVRKIYLRARGPFQWIALKELVTRDTKGADAPRWQAQWKALQEMKNKPFIIQYLLAPDPPTKR